jgi:hypothetical protein
VWHPRPIIVIANAPVVLRDGRRETAHGKRCDLVARFVVGTVADRIRQVVGASRAREFEDDRVAFLDRNNPRVS